MRTLMGAEGTHLAIRRCRLYFEGVWLSSSFILDRGKACA